MNGTRPAEACVGFERSLRNYYGCFDVAPLDDQRRLGWYFRDIKAGPFNGCRISAEGMRSTRPSLPDNWAASGFILANFGSPVTLDHHGRTSTLSAGDIILLDSRAPCSIATYDLTDSICLNVSRDRLGQIASRDGEIFGIPISGSTGTGHLLNTILLTLLKQDDTPDPLDQQVMTDVTVQLLSAALSRQTPAFRMRDKHTEIIDRMRHWVMQHIGEPWLNAQSLSTEFHYSTRSLYRLFTRIGTTPQEWLWEQRLMVAHKMLNETNGGSVSITEIAHATGFSDCSHFTRRFRSRFGYLPSETRRRSPTGH